MKHILATLLLALTCQTAHAFPTYATGGFRGANLMTSDEVKAHVSHLLSIKTFPECTAYMEAHEVLLQQRAQQQNISLPEPSGDPCNVMRFLGRIR